MIVAAAVGAVAAITAVIAVPRCDRRRDCHDGAAEPATP